MANVIDATTGGIVSTGDSTAALDIKTGGTTAISIGTGQSVTITNLVLTDLSLASANITTLTGTSATITNIFDGDGAVRAIPQSGSAKTGSYTLAVGDVGQFIEVGSGGSITVPDATFAAGDVVSIFNNTTGTVTLTMSITTAYIGGADVDEATIDLATRGVATILFISGTVCVVNGNVS